MRKTRFTGIPRASGVYRFYRDGVCVYVGSSQNLRDRITSHRHLKVCDRWEYDLVPLDGLDAEEQRLIDELRPSLNRASKVSPRRDRSARVAIRFGIALTEEDQRIIADIQKAVKDRDLLCLSVTSTIRYALRMAVAQIGRHK